MKNMISVLLIFAVMLGGCSWNASENMVKDTDSTIAEVNSTGEPSETYEESVYDDHTHEPAEEPQTVADPVMGYCGNTLTTVYLDGEEYTFWGEESVTLTDILINLDYDPMKICRCAEQFRVDTEFGTGYGVNLAEGFARCEDGQADLTLEQTERILQIIENLE